MKGAASERRRRCVRDHLTGTPRCHPRQGEEAAAATARHAGCQLLRPKLHGNRDALRASRHHFGDQFHHLARVDRRLQLHVPGCHDHQWLPCVAARHHKGGLAHG